MTARHSLLGTAITVPDGIRAALKELLGEGAAEAIDRTRVLEHSLFASLHGRARATTRRRCIFLRGSATEFLTDPSLMLHEYCHVLLQWETGALTVCRYLREGMRRGYWNNRYEVEAREFTQRHLSQFRALLATHRWVTPARLTLRSVQRP